MGRSLSFRPSERRLTSTEAAQLKEVLGAGKTPSTSTSRTRTMTLRSDVEVAAADESADDSADDSAEDADKVALVVREEWLRLILQGDKTWEIRGTPTKKKAGDPTC